MMEKWAEVVNVWMRDNRVKDNRIRDLMGYVKQVIRENSEIQERVKDEKSRFEKGLEENLRLREKVKDQSWKMSKLNKIIVGLQSEVNELRSRVEGNKSMNSKTGLPITVLNKTRGSCPELFQVPLNTNLIKCKPTKNINSVGTPNIETSQYISELKSKIEELEGTLKESLCSVNQLTQQKLKFEETVCRLQQDLSEKTMAIDQITNENSLNSKYFERKIKEKQIEYSKLTEELEVAKRVNRKLLADLEGITKEKGKLNGGRVVGKKEKLKEDFGPIRVLWNTPRVIRSSTSGSFFGEDESEPSLYLSKSDNESQSPSRLPLHIPLLASEAQNSLAPNPKSLSYKITISTPKDSPKTVPLLNRRKTLKIQVSPSTSP